MTSVLPYALHTVLASVWFGGLPAFLTVLFATTRTRTHEEADRSGIQTLKHFSKMALPVMIAVVATGIVVADRMVDTSYASLVATSYGWFLNTKLALLAVILVIAARARLVWLPSLSQNAGCGCGRWTKASKMGHSRSPARVSAGVGSDIVGERRAGEAYRH